MKKSKFLILWLLSLAFPFLFITNVKAIVYDYTFDGYNKATRVDFGLYNDTTLIQSALTSCTSSNDGYCSFDNEDLPTSEANFNNLRFVIRGTDGVSFTSGGQYKLSFFFSQSSSNYYISQNTLTQTTGNTYQNFTSWTSNEIGIVSSNIVPIETVNYGQDNTATLYRVDIVFSVTSSTISGFNFRLYRQMKTTYASTPVYIELFRYISINQVTPGSIDYTDNFNNVINNQNQNTQDIIDNNNQNTQDIIDNNNQNTQALIDSQSVCNDIVVDKDYIGVDNVSLTASGGTTASSKAMITPYISVTSASIIKVLYRYNASSYNCWYDSNKVVLSCFANNTLQSGDIISIPNGASFIRFSVHKEYNLPRLEVKSCKNGSQAVTDAITDTTPPDTSELSEMAGWLPPGPVDSILTLPISLLNNLTTSLNGTCQPVNLPIPFINSTIPLPCISTIYEEIGIQTFLNWVGGIASAFILFRYLMRLYKWVDDTLTLRENTQSDWGGD